MERAEIRITGLGGQGIILLGYVLGRAASLYEDKHAVLTQSFGPEARGSACSAQVVVHDKRIAYPYTIHPGFLIALSQDGYDKHIGACAPDAHVFYDHELIEPRTDHTHHGVGATRLAEEVGRRILLNMVMLGFFGKLSGICEAKSFLKAIEAAVPKGTEKLNQTAFERGWEVAA